MKQLRGEVLLSLFLSRGDSLCSACQVLFSSLQQLLSQFAGRFFTSCFPPSLWSPLPSKPFTSWCFIFNPHWKWTPVLSSFTSLREDWSKNLRHQEALHLWKGCGRYCWSVWACGTVSSVPALCRLPISHHSAGSSRLEVGRCCKLGPWALTSSL